MSRRTTAVVRRSRAPQPLPKFWRPKLSASGVLDCSVIHWDLVSRFASGQANCNDLVDWIETGYTYSEMLRLLRADGLAITDEARATMDALLDSFDNLLRRYQATGRAAFNGPELQLARTAAELMDQLAACDRHSIALKAALWSCERVARLNLRADLAAAPLPQPSPPTERHA